ncbi:MAG: potassium channel family protein, partial [Planctomycetota bacterium]
GIIFPILLAMVVAGGTIGYHLLAELSLVESLYVTIITISTVGSREAPDLTPAVQWLTMGVIILGVGLAAATFSVAVAALTEGTVERALGRRQVQRAIQQLNGHVIVCGFGRLGSMVVDSLKARDRAVVAIDINEEVFDRPDRADVLRVVGDAQEEVVLAAAGIERAAYLVACLHDDADNTFLTLTARQMNPSLKIVARAELPATQRKLRHAGADRVICPQIIGATRIADVIVRPAVVDFFDMANKGVDLEMDQWVVAADSELVNKSLRELDLPRRTGAIVVAVQHADGRTVYNPGAELVLAAGDTLILIGQAGSRHQVQHLRGISVPPDGGRETH